MYSQSTLPIPTRSFTKSETMLALLVVLSLLLQSLPALTPPIIAPINLSTTSEGANTAELPPIADLPLDLPAELVGKPEIAALRTLDSRTFDLGDGRFARLQAEQPLHYQDDAGDWQPINPAFAWRAGRWINNRNLVRSVLDPHQSAANLALAGVQLHWQPQALEGMGSDGRSTVLATLQSSDEIAARTPDGRAIRYGQSWVDPNHSFLSRWWGKEDRSVQDQWQSAAGSIEYTMRLAALPTLGWWQATPTALDLHVQLHLQPGATLQVDGQLATPYARFVTHNPLIFQDSGGEQLVLQPPLTYEEEHPAVAVAGEYIITIGDDPSLVDLRVRTPWRWLAAPERQFPVIIDPLFQVRASTQRGMAVYTVDQESHAPGDPGKITFANNVAGLSFTKVGREESLLHRGLVRFGLPTMPPGTQIDKAYLLAIPTRIGEQSYLRMGMTAHKITSTFEWWNGVTGSEPTYDPTPLPADQSEMRYSTGDETHSGIRWDVTSVASGWLAPINSNFGLLLRVNQETCEWPKYAINQGRCGRFYFDQAADNWEKSELENTQINSTPDAPAISASKRGGLRLIVFYHNQQTLLENSPITILGDGSQLPQGLDKNPPFYYADHLYTVAKPPAKWQAVVARTHGAPIGLQHPIQVGPRSGKVSGSTRLRRRLGAAAPYSDLFFNATWAFDVNGWPQMTHSLSADANNPAPPEIASLLLTLGNSVTLDLSKADGDLPRRFTAVRAQSAIITQKPELGGASKPVQAVILPRGVAIPQINALCPGSCVDLRGPNDTATLAIPDRVWQMPDVHTNVNAQTVMMRSAGVVQVYSTDHPNIDPAQAGAFSKEFSFDAYQATVSVDYAVCDPQHGGDKVLVIRGQTSMTLPNIGAGTGGLIAVGFKLCETKLRNVNFNFESPVGVPLGNSGLFLTGIRGDIEIGPDYTRVTMGLNFQAAPGGDGGVFKAYGEVTIDTQGLFSFTGGATVLGVINAEGNIWVAWNPLDTGFEVSISVGNWLRGFQRAHMWVGQGWQHRYTWLPDNDEKHMTGEIGATLTIQEGAIADWELLQLPAGDIDIQVELAFGEFCTNSSCTSYEWGIKGQFVVVGYNVGMYYGFDEGIDFILGNDSHILIDEYGGGLVSAAAAGVNMLAAPEKVDGVATIPFAVSPSAEQILVGLSWQAGAPILSLINPDGVEIKAETIANFNGQAQQGANSAILTLQAPKAGAWQAKLSNLSAQGVEHYKFMYLANKGAPGVPGNRGAFTAPVNANEVGTGTYNITWQAPADTPSGATIRLFYYRTSVITGNLELGMPIVQNLPFSTGSYQWQTTGLRNGEYRLRAVVDDGVNALPAGQISASDDTCQPATSGLPGARAFDPNRFPGTVVFTSTGTIALNDVTPPAMPSGLSLTVADSAILAQWDAANQDDVSSYLVRWGLKNAGNPQGFVVQNQTLITAPNGKQPLQYIGAVDNGKEYGVDVIALDANGNASAPTPAQFATPDGAGNPVPLSPQNFGLSGKDGGSASFTWQANGNGPAPASYRLTYVRLTKFAPVVQLAVTATNAKLDNLVTGVTYDVQVSARNSTGWASLPAGPLRVTISNGADGNGDGLPDDWARAHNVSSGAADSDGDGVNNAAEFAQGSDPQDQDSDNDGASDGEEQSAATDPLDGAEFSNNLTQPRLALAEDTLRFDVKLQPGGEAAPQQVTWQNVGGGNLQLQASSGEAWIQPSIVGAAVQVAINSSGLSKGFHSGVVRLSAAPGSDPLIGTGSRCIRVNTWVLAADNDLPAQPKQAQSISFAPLANKLISDAAFDVSATASSGLPVVLISNTPTVCTVAGTRVTLVGAGLCTLVATQAGNGQFEAAVNVAQSFNVIDPAKPATGTIYLPIIQR